MEKRKPSKGRQKMKFLTIFITLLLCVLTTNSKAQETDVQPAQDATGISLSDIKREIARFKQAIEETKTRNLPLIVDTNFDSFIDEADYNAVDVKSLKLDDIIYHNFNKDVHKYKAIASYRINFSEDFYSIVVTVIKGDTKMESVLINYTLDGEFISSILVAYDELTENPTRIISKIIQHRLTRNHIFIEGGEERIEQSEHRVATYGKIEELSSEEVLVEEVIQQIGLENAKLNRVLVTTKVNPENTQETIMVIPEYGTLYDDETFFNLNTYLVIVNNLTGAITHKYFESSKTNGWVSDAIRLSGIIIDTAPYIVSENKRAFGVRVSYEGMSRANPYSNETISLFVKSGDALQKVLHNYDVMNYGGEWDTNCAGEFNEEKKVLIIAEETTNGFFDIIVKSTLIHSVNYVPEDGDCEIEKDVTRKKVYLKFDGKTYISN